MKTEFNKETESLKKKPNETKVEMRNSEIQPKTLEESLTNKLDGMQERISEFEDNLKKTT